jgi:membrane-bound lytic murein transglycosylase A
LSRRAAVVCLLLAACAQARSAPVSSTFADDGDLASLRQAIGRGRATGDEVRTRLLKILEGSDERAAAIQRSFRVVRVADPVLLTAYYEPELAARHAADGVFRYPIYRHPDGARPMPTRAAIDGGALAGRQLELAWTDDPLRLFALHVQGSGRLRLADGAIMRVGYAGTNGRPYGSIAPALRARGLLPDGPASWPEIRSALATLPREEQLAVLATNERYTFFRPTPDADPVGSLGVPLTPGRSIAVDPKLVRPGTVAYLETETVRRFVVAQDTGVAIKGARADLFLGAGADAEARAGTMREHGVLYVLTPR